MSYKPRPIDTSRVIMPEQLSDLTEQLSENVHEVWARQRISDGWTRGPERDDTSRKHPNLVPYEELSEPEKEYDRSVAMETLKAIVALGYRIEKGG